MSAHAAHLVPLLLKVGGLPAHPLIVHGAVVFGPLAALGTLAYLVPAWRDRLRWPVLAAVVLAFVFIWAAYLTGDNFKESSQFFEQSAQVHRHEEYADVLRWVTTGFAVVAVAYLLPSRFRATGGAARIGLDVLLGALAVATLVYVVLTGDAGARAVWG